MQKVKSGPPVKTHKEAILFDERVDLMNKELREHTGGKSIIERQSIMEFFNWKDVRTAKKHLTGIQPIGATKKRMYHTIDVARKLALDEITGNTRRAG